MKTLRRSVRPKVDFWSLFDLDYGRELPCGNSYVLLWAIISGDGPIKCQPSVFSKYATVTVLGPVADDAVYAPTKDPDAAVPHAYRLRVKYDLKAHEAAKWSAAERRAFVREVKERGSGASAALVFKALGL